METEGMGERGKDPRRRGAGSVLSVPLVHCLEKEDGRGSERNRLQFISVTLHVKQTADRKAAESSDCSLYVYITFFHISFNHSSNIMIYQRFYIYLVKNVKNVCDEKSFDTMRYKGK